MFAGGGVELLNIVLRMDGIGAFGRELAHCIEVSLGRHKLKVLPVERVLASKRAANRAKDRLVIPVLEDSLAARLVAARRGKRKTSVSKKRRLSR